MDPDENLLELMELANELEEETDDPKAQRVVELLIGLDEWLAGGGFLPERWRMRKE